MRQRTCDICETAIIGNAGLEYTETVYLLDVDTRHADAETVTYDLCSLKCAEEISGERRKSFLDAFAAARKTT